MKHYLLSALMMLMALITAQAQNITVNGTVLSATDDEPLIGASVVPASTNQGVTTDYDGNFTISVPENTVLNSTDQYVNIVRGKNGGASYSKLLQEFRSTFLNIDTMIIENLNDLFFGLW